MRAAALRARPRRPPRAPRPDDPHRVSIFAAARRAGHPRAALPRALDDPFADALAATTRRARRRLGDASDAERRLPHAPGVAATDGAAPIPTRERSAAGAAEVGLEGAARDAALDRPRLTDGRWLPATRRGASGAQLRARPGSARRRHRTVLGTIGRAR